MYEASPYSEQKDDVVLYLLTITYLTQTMQEIEVVWSLVVDQPYFKGLLDTLCTLLYFDWLELNTLED